MLFSELKELGVLHQEVYFFPSLLNFMNYVFSFYSGCCASDLFTVKVSQFSFALYIIAFIVVLGG